jgi:hypothetical protein
MDEIVMEGIIVGAIEMTFIIFMIFAIYSQRDND